MMRFLICRYNEITLKGKNRRFFEVALRENLKRCLAGIPHRRVFRLSGRVLVELHPRADEAQVRERAERLFGVANWSWAFQGSTDLQELETMVWDLVKDRAFETFKIDTRRTPHSLPHSSREVNERLGAMVVRRSGKSVRLKGPDLTCRLEFVEDHSFISLDTQPGAGGLPVGSSGKIVSLLSGGIDSPVAAYRMMRRGCRVIFVHFHSFPHTSAESQDKVRDLVRLLNSYQYRSTLYLVPFAECQRRIVAQAPPAYRVILYRRQMLRIAESIARRKRCWALASGDSLGQVASQTLENLAVVSQAAQRPVLRPLIGNDKQETIDWARKIGAYPISIRPDDDCCSLFLPPRPATRASLSRLLEIEEGLDLSESLSRALAESRRESYRWPDPEPQVRPPQTAGSPP